MTMPEFLVVLRSMNFDVPEGASHVVINDYSEPTRISFVMAGGHAPPVTRELTEAERSQVLEGLALHRRTRAVVKRVDQ